MVNLFKDKKSREELLLIYLLLLLFSVIYLQICYNDELHVWSVPNPDTITTLTVARTFIHGHPMSLNKGDPPGTILSDLLSPIFYAVGYYMGFRSTNAMMLWVYIMVFFISLLASTFLYVFFKRELPEVAFVATSLCVLFSGIYHNLYSTNFGYTFLFFWGALAFIDSLPLFLTFSVLASLLRPEGPFIYALLLYFYVLRHGRERLWRVIVPGLISFLPFVVYKFITGSFFPQGVQPQNIIRYEGLSNGLFYGLSVFIDQIKGLLLGYFPAQIRIGISGSAFVGTFPPLLFIFSLLGLWKHKREWSLPLLLFLIFLIAGDSLSIFSAVHENRHIHLITPFFIGFSIYFVYKFREREKSYFPLYITYILLFFVTQFIVSSINSRKSAVYNSGDKEVTDYIAEKYPHTPLVGENIGGLYYWGDDRIRITCLSPGIDPYLGKYLRYYVRFAEISEYLQRRVSDTVLMVSYLEDRYITKWLIEKFSIKRIKTFQNNLKKRAELYLLDLTRIKDKPPYGKPFDELDVADPISEYQHRYRYYSFTKRSVGNVLFEGDAFFDGGRPYIAVEDFVLKFPEGGGILVARYRGLYPAKVQSILDKFPVNFHIERATLTIYANGREIFKKDVNFQDDFTLLEIPVSESGFVRFHLEGLFNSFHYWVYRK